jgi:FKBP-type peptidyl-prolyl cis-trans isomerase FklB
MNMKIKMIFVLLLGVVVLCSCKENNWLDWKSRNELWLANNAKQEGVITTPTGLQYKCFHEGPEGSSAHVYETKVVKIKYSGQLISGLEFDANDGYIGEVRSFVPGFAEGLKLMKEFSIYEFYIPYELGYGEEGNGAEGSGRFIPPYSTLVFRVELLDIN